MPDLASSIIRADERQRVPGRPSSPPVSRKELAEAGYWFGPRSGRLGWGWTPVSWRGWVVVAVAAVAAVVAEIAGRDEWHDALYAGPLVAGLVAVCLWKGTAPGPSARAERQLRAIAEEREPRAGGST